VPTDTFLSLPEEKRERIISIGMADFGRYTYNGASISRIVRRAGIAKGSIYQYFADKYDFYLYLLSLAAERKLTAISNALQNGDEDFYGLYRRLLLAGARWDFSNPSQSLLLTRAMREPAAEEIGDVSAELMRSSAAFLKPYVAEARRRGSIRRDLDLELVIHLVNSMTLSLAAYLENRYGFSLQSLLISGGGTPPFSEEQLTAHIDELTRFLETGLRPRNM
jgi:AcrR family transcriptional regulator